MQTIPNEKALGYGLRSIGPAFIDHVFLKLVREPLKYKIIIPRIGSEDGVFIRSHWFNKEINVRMNIMIPLHDFGCILEKDKT